MTRNVLRSSFVVVLVAFFLNVPWEFAHSVFYQCFPAEGIVKEPFLLMHFRAALGDAVFTLLLLWGGMFLTRSALWWQRLTLPRAAVLVLAGVLLAVGIEVDALFIHHRWTYTRAMPTILGVGISPLLQMAVLPLLTLLVARRLLEGPSVRSAPRTRV